MTSRDAGSQRSDRSLANSVTISSDSESFNPLDDEFSPEVALQARPTSEPRLQPAQSKLVQSESHWRRRPNPVGSEPGQNASRIALSRWVDSRPVGVTEVYSDQNDDSHILSIVSHKITGEISLDGRSVWSGQWFPNTMFLTGPAQGCWRGVVRTSYNVFRIFIPQSLLVECHEATFGRAPAGPICLFESQRLENDNLGQIARTLRGFEASDALLGPSFLDALGLTLTSRLLGLYHSAIGVRPSKVSPLAKWRLIRVIEYIDAHLERPIYLAELSDVAGLSRMHFASQFRAATGHAPAAYIVQCRVARAQELLKRQDVSIVEAALRTGFSSQAHMTQAFRKILGDTPARWRRTMGD
ncbi:AraC family transcriptional regulator [Rhizobium sp. WYJ-E13]|uniref:AraC family transcriptional regulator n=1 Tax=Rhizobium sp. WYJ-E13 TaxID=2849093 RepID=UPI001C1F0B7A|nr:AraC family transcriptional regulator [Rhizobium sp. WYJ-E13]QWW72456.1 AraC family transcriptional regulator [Rhizobium sp. WYJ-E13]